MATTNVTHRGVTNRLIVVPILILCSFQLFVSSPQKLVVDFFGEAGGVVTSSLSMAVAGSTNTATDLADSVFGADRIDRSLSYNNNDKKTSPSTQQHFRSRINTSFSTKSNNEYFSYDTMTRIQLQKQPSLDSTSQQDIWISRPTDHNTVICLIAMGPNTGLTPLPIRLIRSVRASGDFHGYVVLLTDSYGYEHLKNVMPVEDPKVLVLKVKKEELSPLHKLQYPNGTLYTLPIIRKHMIYKRFKTLLPQYIQHEAAIPSEMEYIFYLDVDNLVTAPLQPIFDDYFYELPKRYQRNIENDLVMHGNAVSSQFHQKSMSFISMWREPNGVGKYQSGQILMHIPSVQGCLDIWREQIETNYKAWMEQPLLVMSLDNQYNTTWKSFLAPVNDTSTTHSFCHVLELPNAKKYWDLASPEYFRPEKLGRASPPRTILHFTHIRIKKSSEEQQNAVIRKAMNLHSIPVQNAKTIPSIINSNNHNNSSEIELVFATMEDNATHYLSRNSTYISWQDVAISISTQGERSKVGASKQAQQVKSNTTTTSRTPAKTSAKTSSKNKRKQQKT